jgi:Mn-dependent DtxR family transcriptional regulator
VAFTSAGRGAAAAAVRRLRLAEALLARTLGRCAAECGRETPLAAGWEDQVAEFLGWPERCPHGRPIAPEAPAAIQPALPLAAPAKAAHEPIWRPGKTAGAGA